MTDDASEIKPLTIEDVHGAWTHFLQEARRISKTTEMMMVTTRPAEVDGDTVVIEFVNRAGHDISSQPGQQEFVRKLLAKCLGREKVQVRFRMGDLVPPPPVRRSEIVKPLRDPLAELAALELSLPPLPPPRIQVTVEVTAPTPEPKPLPPPVPAAPAHPLSYEEEVTRLRLMPYPEHLQTFHWQYVRRRALERAGHRCQFCNSTERLNVHHRTYENRGDEKDWDVIVLCYTCHDTFHEHRELADKKPRRSRQR